MKYIIWTVAIVLVLGAGCYPKKADDANAQASGGSTATTTSGGALPPAKINIGDIESQTQVQGLLAKESQTPSVTAKEEKSLKNTLTMCTVTVNPPAPAQLFVSFSVKIPRELQKGSNVVVLRGQIMRDNKPIQPFSLIFGGNAAPLDPAMAFKADALKDLPAPIPSMLVHAQVDIVLLPEGTDATLVDIAQVTGDADHTSTIMSNPVRINFAAPGATS